MSLEDLFPKGGGAPNRSIYETWQVVTWDDEDWVSLDQIVPLVTHLTPPAATRQVAWALLCEQAGMPVRFFHDSGEPTKLRYGIPRVPEWLAPFISISFERDKVTRLMLRAVKDDLEFREAGLAVFRLGGPEKLLEFVIRSLIDAETPPT